MARRLPKFPLEMANGAKVRNIEDLRENADVDSIMTYFLSGQLNLWCRAFGYDNLPEQFENINIKLIKSIYEALEIPADDSQIEAYVKENGIHISGKSVSNAETEEEVVDNEEVKNKLKSYVDSDISLSDYSVEVIPVNDDNGNLCKYKIIIANEKTEQYASFILAYDVGGNYKKNHFIDDFYKKIANTIKQQHNMFSYNGMKNSRYAELKVGDTFEFGTYKGKPITWKVIFKEKDKLYVLSYYILCERKWDSNSSNVWRTSDIRNWLNNKFYQEAFTPAEKEFIVKIATQHYIIDYSSGNSSKIIASDSSEEPDYITLLDFCEVSCLIERGIDIKASLSVDFCEINCLREMGFEMTFDTKASLLVALCDDVGWWLRTSYTRCRYPCVQYCVNKSIHNENYQNVSCSAGIRPAFWLKY